MLPRRISTLLPAWALVATLPLAPGCDDRKDKTAKTRPIARSSRRSVEARTPSPAPAANSGLAMTSAGAATLAVTPPLACAEGDYHVYPALRRGRGIEFCLFRLRQGRCGAPMKVWKDDPLARRPCLRYDLDSRRFSLLEHRPKPVPRYPAVTSVEPLKVCAAPGSRLEGAAGPERCRLYPALRGLQRAVVDPAGRRVAVLYDDRARARAIGIYLLGAAPRPKLERTITAPVEPAKVQLLDHHVAWVDARGYGSGVTHVHALDSGRFIRTFGEDGLHGRFESRYSPLVRLGGGRWAAVHGLGEAIVIDDFSTAGRMRRIGLEAYFKPLRRAPQVDFSPQAALRRTRSIGQSRLIALAGQEAGKLAVVFGDPVVGVAIVDVAAGAITRVDYAHCF